MAETYSVRIGTARDVYGSPSEAYVKIRSGPSEKVSSRIAKKSKDGKWAWNELLQVKKDPVDKNFNIEIWEDKLMKNHMLAYVSVDVTDPKLPQTATWYSVGKPKDPTPRGEIELTFEISGSKTPRKNVPNLKELDAQMGIEFAAPAASPRPVAAINPSQHFSELTGESMWLAVGETEIGYLKRTQIGCDVMTVKITYSNDSGATFNIWLPQQGFSWENKEYNQGPYVRAELDYKPLKTRPCFKVKYHLYPGEGDLGQGLLDGKLISDQTKSTAPIKGCFKISKSEVQKTIDNDSHYDAAHVYDERELLDVSFKAIPEKVRACLDRWDDVNIQNESRETPLHRAVMNGNQEIITMLIERGADPRIADKFGQTPADIAEKYFKKDLIPLLRTYQ